MNYQKAGIYHQASLELWPVFLKRINTRNCPSHKLIQPAIDLAQNGYAISKREANGLNGNKADFVKNSTAPATLVKDAPWKEGDTLRQPELAATLIRIYVTRD